MNKVIEGLGGDDWRKSSEAVALIQDVANCSAEEAEEALQKWIENKYVRARHHKTHKLVEAKLSIPVEDYLMLQLPAALPPPPAGVPTSWLRFFEININDLRAVLNGNAKAQRPRTGDRTANHLAIEDVERTGVPGRPTNIQLVLAEAETRRKCGASVQAVKAESKLLANWFLDSHPDKRPPSAKTIENKIRREHKRYWFEKPHN